MAFENLDQLDRAICEALLAGKDEAELMTELQVSKEKIDQLRPIVEEVRVNQPVTGEGVTGATAITDAPVQPAEPQGDVSPEVAAGMEAGLPQDEAERQAEDLA